jgi:hypothetical protein
VKCFVRWRLCDGFQVEVNADIDVLDAAASAGGSAHCPLTPAGLAQAHGHFR